jgi:hypothetical protein
MLDDNYRPTVEDLDKALEIQMREFCDSDAPQATNAERDLQYLVMEAFNASPTGRIYGEDRGTPSTIGEARARLDKRYGSITDHWRT